MIIFVGTIITGNVEQHLKCAAVRGDVCSVQYRNTTYYKGSKYEKTLSVGQCVAGEAACGPGKVQCS